MDINESPQSVQQTVPSEYDEVKNLDLKNPALAGFLSWLVPGAGQYYQGRTAKGILFFLCIVPMFITGCVLGSSNEVGWARNVYYSWRPEDKRLAFLAQGCLGIAAIPAGIQAIQVNSGSPPPFGRFMAPPQINDYDKMGIPPTTAKIITELHYLIELGKFLTIFAGLMNLLVIFDAVDGPLVYRKNEEETAGEAV